MTANAQWLAFLKQLSIINTSIIWQCEKIYFQRVHPPPPKNFDQFLFFFFSVFIVHYTDLFT